MNEQNSERTKEFGELVLHEAKPIGSDGSELITEENPVRYFIRDTNTGSFVYTSTDLEQVADVKQSIETKRKGE